MIGISTTPTASVSVMGIGQVYGRQLSWLNHLQNSKLVREERHSTRIFYHRAILPLTGATVLGSSRAVRVHEGFFIISRLEVRHQDIRQIADSGRTRTHPLIGLFVRWRCPTTSHVSQWFHICITDTRRRTSVRYIDLSRRGSTKDNGRFPITSDGNAVRARNFKVSRRGCSGEVIWSGSWLASALH